MRQGFIESLNRRYHDSPGEHSEAGLWVPEIRVVYGFPVVFRGTESDEVQACPLGEWLEVAARDQCHSMTPLPELAANGDERVYVTGTTNGGEEYVKGGLSHRVGFSSGTPPVVTKLSNAAAQRRGSSRPLQPLVRPPIHLFALTNPLAF